MQEVERLEKEYEEGEELSNIMEKYRAEPQIGRAHV